MQIVIDIPDKIYSIAMEGIDRAIKNGTVLPKTHSRLISADNLQAALMSECVGKCNCCEHEKRRTDGGGEWYTECGLVDEAPTVLEADKEDK